MALVVTCAACQKAKSVIVVNECGREVQATASDIAPSVHPDPNLLALAAGVRKHIRLISDTATEVFLSVRASGTDEPVDFSLHVEVPSGQTSS